MQGVTRRTNGFTAAATMPRHTKAKPADLSINPMALSVSTRGEGEPDPKSSPMDLEGIDLSSFGGDIGLDIASLPPLPLSPPIPQSPGFQQKDTFKNGNKGRMAAEPETKEQRQQIRQVKDEEDYRANSSNVSKVYHLRKNPGSTPELSLVGSKENVRSQATEVMAPPPPDRRPHPSPYHSEDSVSVRSRGKGFRNPLMRSKSIRRDSDSKSQSNDKLPYDQPPKTAPLMADWSGSNDRLKVKASDRRGHSAERAVTSESDENMNAFWKSGKEKEKDGRGFMTGSKNVMSKAVAGGGSLLNRLGKVGRSGSSHAKEVPDSEYKLKIITLPLVEQTRITRISKDLSKCRDKTEYWMPSLPWRCIDYLNQNCESEGLYRVPGSAPQVRMWQRRFDTELDVNLLDEHDLHDSNNIGSMLKAWIRELPDEIMAGHLQKKLAAELADDNSAYREPGQPAPQKLRDALSRLPPFNYYLLFAITCHLSLLLNHKDKNKMNLGNLWICIGPCLDLESWLFNYLVGDWRHCWQGCWTEKDYLEAERAFEQGADYVAPTNMMGDEEALEDSSTSDRPLYSRGQDSTRSRATSAHGSARDSPSRPLENGTAMPSHSNSALPSRLANGTSGPQEKKQAASQEQRRPATAGKTSEGSAADTTTPTLSHSRSRSEYQLSPVQPSSPVDFPFSRAEDA